MKPEQIASKPKFRGRTVGLIGILLVVAIGAYAYKRIFARPGEDALRMIPANATLFASLDLSPSVTQAPVFKRIEDGIVRNRLDTKLTDMVGSMLAKEPIGQAIRPYFKRSVTFAILEGNGSPDSDVTATRSVVLIGISDHQAVENVLKEKATAQQSNGTSYYSLGKTRTYVAVIDDQLAICSDPKTLSEVQQVASGKAASVLSTGDYASARASLDPDCNLMFFMNPKLIENMKSMLAPGSKSTEPGQMAMMQFKWIAYGFAVRDGGIGISMSQEFDPNSAFAAMAKVPPLRKDLLTTLPAGAFAVYSVSDSSEGIKVSEKMMGSSGKEVASMIEDFRKKLEKSTGLNVDRDLIPAFAGDCSFAVYPSSDPKVAPVEVLAVLDDSNGADPASVAPRVRKSIETALGSDGHPASFVERTVNGVQIFDLPASALQNMGKSVQSSVKGLLPSGSNGSSDSFGFKADAQYNADVKKAFDDAQKRRASGKQSGMDTQLQADFKRAMESAKLRQAPHASTPPATEPPMPLGSVCYAVVGKSVLIASSDKLLERAVATYGSHADSLSTDAAFSSHGSLAAEHQLIGLLSLSRVAESIEAATGGKSGEPEAGPMSKFLDMLKGLKEPLVMSSTFGQTNARGNVFIPMDFDKLLDLIGSSSGPATSPGQIGDRIGTK